MSNDRDQEVQEIIAMDDLSVAYHPAGPYAKLWRVHGFANNTKLTVAGYTKESAVLAWDAFAEILLDHNVVNATIYLGSPIE